MALVLKDRVQEVSTTSGTGTLTLTGAVSGFQTFSTAIGNGNTTYYTIYDSTAYVWEVGIGTVGAGTLARTTVLANSSGTTSPINLAGNSVFVFCTYPAEKSINYDADGVATIGSTLGYTDTGIIASFASTVAGYNQVVLQNKSTATNASTNFNVSNDAGTAGSNYAELGINSSTFTGTGSFNIAGASYVASASTDLTLGTYGAYSIHFVTNSSTTDAMTIFNNGGISLGGFTNPGIGNMAASKFVPGYAAVTSAAGTTTLTASSNYYQNLIGTTTQTFKLPDATTLLEGTTFIFDNDSTGTLTVVDNASGPIETVPAGAASFVYLADNATVAGTWRRHAFLPASYDFNSSTANFGNATITSAVWNGTTIASGYGGTGLTTFTAANNALYSTSASALVAGTLPVAAGGSGAVTFTANGILYGDGTNPLGVTAAGTTGQVLVGNTGGAPSWATLSSSTVSSFSAGTTGFTPNSATTGAVTLAGTLNVANGGTGQTTATAAFDALNPMTTVGDIIYEGTGPTATRLGIGSTGQVLTVSGGIPSWATPAANVSSISFGSTGLTPSTATTGAVTVAGTLNVANGGTGTSTAFTAGSVVFAGASGVYSQNNAGFFWDNTNSRLGIGTATPTQSLDVNGNLAITGSARRIIGDFSNATLANRVMIQTSTTNGQTQLALIPNGTVSTGATVSGISLEDNTSISTGNGSLGSFTQIQDTDVRITSGIRGTGTYLPLAFYTGGSERVRIDTSGNVGIGTNNPSVKLDVIGSIEASAAATQDGVILAGRAGGTSSYAVTLTPTTLTASRTITLPDATTTMVGTDTTQTLTNKRVTPRVSTTTSSATPTINTDTTDQFGLTALTVNITSFTTNLSGTPTNGQKLWIYIVGTAARTITWGTSFEASTVALPTTTVSTNRLDVGFVWNAATSKWRCVAVA